ncbi:sensor histidine kinase [Nocardioides sp.]|uniref:sensor histidine kinase n=1 Tax=Nocardioides sp. TaxID=35761 RepID=UPI00351420F0
MRVRITATVALLAAVGLTLAGFFVYVLESRRLEEHAVDSAQQELDEFALVAQRRAAAPSGDLTGTLRNFLQRTVPDDGELMLGWVEGQVALQFPQPSPLVSAPAFLDVVAPLADTGGTRRLDIEGRTLVVAAQPIRQGTQDGALVVVHDLRIDRANLLDTMRTYATVATFSLLLISVMAFLQAGRLLAPLRVLRRTAEEISETDLSLRIPEQGNDDITGLTRTVNSMLARLEAAFTGQRQLLDDAGHELRTPLTVLQGHLELLDPEDAQEVAETRQLLLEELDRMSRLVNDLILLARTEQPDFLTTRYVDAASLTESALAKASGLAERDWCIDELALATTPVDEQRITQALLQLAANAVKHTAPGDVVALGSRIEEDMVLWWVRDTGPGVLPSERERIFERFGRGDDAAHRHPEGFGLGLAIVSGIARAHGGDAWLDPDYLDGARFVVAVPMAAPEPLPANGPVA